MNRFKDEQREIFGKLRLSDERKERVLQAVPKKRRNVMPTIIVASIAAICLFFAINGLQSNEDYTTASAIEAYETFLKEQPDNMKVDIKHVELPFERNNDAIIIGIYEQENSDVYHFQHMTFENGEWTFGLSGDSHSRRANEEDGEYVNVTYRIDSHDFGNGGDTIYTGTYTDDNETFFVGDKKGKSFNIEGEKIWIALVNSRAKPVFVEKDGVKKRIAQYPSWVYNVESNIVYQLEDNQYAINYDKDTMHIYGQEYTEFDIVIDSDYTPTYPDVVLVNGDNGPEVVRIQATNDMAGPSVSVKIQESSILINGTPAHEPYSWARAKGNVDYKFDKSIDYGEMGKDEVFVYPDNWLSDGVRGYIRTDQIIGKVLGYSIADIEVNWAEEEIKLYEQVKDKGTAILKNESPQTIALLQLYALLQKDYKTAQVLYEGISSEHMIGYFERANFKMATSLIKYYAHMIKRAEFDEQRNLLVVANPYNDSDIFTWEMVKVDGSWKVKFISKVYQEAFNNE